MFFFLKFFSITSTLFALIRISHTFLGFISIVKIYKEEWLKTPYSLTFHVFLVFIFPIPSLRSFPLFHILAHHCWHRLYYETKKKGIWNTLNIFSALFFSLFLPSLPLVRLTRGGAYHHSPVNKLQQGRESQEYSRRCNKILKIHFINTETQRISESLWEKKRRAMLWEATTTQWEAGGTRWQK